MSQANYRLQRSRRAWFLVPEDSPPPYGHSKVTCPNALRQGLPNGARVLVTRTVPPLRRSNPSGPGGVSPRRRRVTRPL